MRQLGRALDYLRWVTGGVPSAETTDGQLVEAFVARRDPEAFAELLRRHGPMVLSVCRRLLNDPHRADDAFQATFLVLVRKAGSIRGQNSVGGWLQRVATHAALKARVASARSRSLSDEAATMLAAPAEAERPEWLPILDEELGKLPEKYRAPLVLCYLEGKSREEAARLLGWTEGSVKGRLEKGRELLRGRLQRRGAVVASAALAAMLAHAGEVPAAVSADLASSTIHSATLVVDGSIQAVPAGVVAITQGVLTDMALTRTRVLATLLVVLLGSGVGAYSYSRYVPAGPKPAGDDGQIALADIKPEAVKPVPEEIKESTVEKDGLAVTVKPLQPSFGTAETLKFIVTLTNRTKDEMPLTYHPISWGYRFKSVGKPIRTWQAQITAMDATPRNIRTTLAAGQSIEVRAIVINGFRFFPADDPKQSVVYLPPGKYRAEVTVNSSNPDRQVVAGPVDIRVGHPAEQDGLSVVVKPVKAVFTKEKLAFDTTFSNRGKEAMALKYLPSLWSYKFTDLKTGATYVAQVVRARALEGPTEQVLQPGQSVTARVTTTNFSFLPGGADDLPAGKYRLEITLHANDRILLSPEPVEFEVGK